ncbi:hypothetical protein PR048_005581 [Dryococelus australis]|uniref:Uncharacterized protein n=1 Tax=Dryococelus australis TaxID=614101 RepID=A0ABQ9I8N1_9NEOP|nr:hypothetical protein PR048_005581 [Dryococelus australis]
MSTIHPKRRILKAPPQQRSKRRLGQTACGRTAVLKKLVALPDAYAGAHCRFSPQFAGRNIVSSGSPGVRRCAPYDGESSAQAGRPPGWSDGEAIHLAPVETEPRVDERHTKTAIRHETLLKISETDKEHRRTRVIGDAKKGRRQKAPTTNDTRWPHWRCHWILIGDLEIANQKEALSSKNIENITTTQFRIRPILNMNETVGGKTRAVHLTVRCVYVMTSVFGHDQASPASSKRGLQLGTSGRPPPSCRRTNGWNGKEEVHALPEALSTRVQLQHDAQYVGDDALTHNRECRKLCNHPNIVRGFRRSPLTVKTIGAAVVKWLDYSPPTLANRVRFLAGSLREFRVWESCQIMPLFGGFSRGSSFSPDLTFRRYSIPHFTLIGSEDLDRRLVVDVPVLRRRRKQRPWVGARPAACERTVNRTPERDVTALCRRQRAPLALPSLDFRARVQQQAKCAATGATEYDSLTRSEGVLLRHGPRRPILESAPYAPSRETRRSARGNEDMRINCLIVFMRKALDWRAILPSITRLYETFSGYPTIL